MIININHLIRIEMNIKQLYLAKLGVAAFAVALGCASCTDTWDDHYKSDAGVASNETLWEVMQKDPELAPFNKVLTACGYDKILNAQQVYTVWAPKISDSRADELINLYNAEKSKNVKDDDNSMINQFVRNHIALFNHQLSSDNDTIKMMNGKFMVVNSSKFNNNVDIVQNYGVPARNGFMYKLTDEEAFFPNIWERLQADSIGDSGLDSISKYFASYNEYYFDADASVPGGVVDGEIVYLDSVTYLYNPLFISKGEINVEDSSYLFVAPTNKIWREQLEKYGKYFDYNTRNTTMLPKYREYQYEYVRSAIINDLFFNMNSPYNQHANDSLCSTAYSVKDTYHGYNYFEKPFTGNGLLAGLDEPFEASNGYVYKMKDWRIEPSFSFVRPIEIEAENTMRFSVGTSDDSEAAKKTKTATVVRTGNTSKYDVSNEAYLIVDDNNQIASRRQPSVTFDIPNILSNIPYDIKVVFATGKAQDINSKDTLNRKVTAQIEMYNTTTSTDFAKPSNLTTNMIVDGTKMDTLIVSKPEGFTTKVCGYNDEVIRVRLILKSVATTSEINNNKFARRLLIDKIILVPRPVLETDENEN